MLKSRPIRIGLFASTLLCASLACTLVSGAPESEPTATPTSAPAPGEALPTADLPPTQTPPPSEAPPTLAPSPTSPPSTPTEASGGQVEVLETMYSEEFEAPPQDWGTGEIDDEYASLDRQVVDGMYRWEATAKQGFVQVELADPPVELPQGQFQYSTSIKVESSSGDVAFGLLFRAQDLDNFYYFQVINNGHYAVFALVDNEWQAMIESTPTRLLQDGMYNTLTVVGDGTSYEFQINDYVVNEIEDDRFGGGNIGLAMELFEAGDSAAILIDNLRVWVPGEDAARADVPAEVTFRPVEIETFSSGLVYGLEIPEGWSYTTAQGYEIICEPETQAVCFTAYAQPDWTGDDLAFKEQQMARITADVEDYTELHSQHTQINGLPAYSVEYSYQVEGEERLGLATYIVAEGHGFELKGYGSSADFEAYRPVILHIIESFNILSP